MRINMELYTKWFVFVLLCTTSIGLATGLQRYGLQDLCQMSSSSVLSIKSTMWGSDSSGILVAQKANYYQTNRDCTLILQPPGGNGVVLSIRELDLRTSCQDHVTIGYKERTQDKTVMFCNSFAYKNRDVDYSEWKSYYSEGSLSVRFQTGPYFDTRGYNGFEFIFTTVSRTPCGVSEFRCSAGRCISNKLNCDGHNHCGDRSDQNDCRHGASGGAIAGSVFGVIFLIIAIVCCIVIVRRRNRTIVTTTTSHPPPQPYYPTQQYVQQPYQNPPQQFQNPPPPYPMSLPGQQPGY